jgi:hypothetical protein
MAHKHRAKSRPERPSIRFSGALQMTFGGYTVVPDAEWQGMYRVRRPTALSLTLSISVGLVMPLGIYRVLHRGPRGFYLRYLESIHNPAAADIFSEQYWANRAKQRAADAIKARDYAEAMSALGRQEAERDEALERRQVSAGKGKNGG